MNILAIVLCVYAAVWMPIILYDRLGWFKFFYHDLLHWHIPDEDAEVSIKGINVHTKCKHCGKDIIQDSQGNWFES